MLASGVGFVWGEWRAGRLDGEEYEGIILPSVSVSGAMKVGSRSILNACLTCRIVVDSP